MNYSPAQPSPDRQPTPALRKADSLPKTVGIRDFNEWCKSANLRPRIVMLKLVGGDHASMRMLETVLLWGESDALSDGWFYRTQPDWEAEDGLTRRILPRTTAVLKSLGLVTKVRRIKTPDGKIKGGVATFYRLDPAAFASVCKSRIEKITKGDKHVTGSRETHLLSNRETHDLGDPEMHEMCGPTLEESLKESGEGIPEEISQGARTGEGETSFVPPLHRYLLDFVPALGEPNGHRPLLEAEIQRLGDDEARTVLLGCNKAKSWQYILTALTNRETPVQQPPPSSAPPPSGENEGESFITVPLTFPPLGGLWATACHIVPDAHVRRALTYAATITEPDVMVIRIEAAPFDGDLLAAEGVQAALDIMRDMDIAVEIVQQPLLEQVGAA